MKIWFYIDSIRWTPERLAGVNTPDLGGSVGGTEAMTVGLCRHFVQRGHDVTLWATKIDVPGVHDGLLWRRVEPEKYVEGTNLSLVNFPGSGLRGALLNEQEPDMFVAVRRPEVFSLPEAQDLRMYRVLWAGDVLERSQGYIPYLRNVDSIVYVSEWHKRQWESIHPPLTKMFYSFVTPVASNEKWIPKPNSLIRSCTRCDHPQRGGVHDDICRCGGWLDVHDHNRYTFMYASQPDRGLVPLLEMWPYIRTQLTAAKLLIAGYTADVTRTKILADRLIADVNKKYGGIEVVRSSNKAEYFKHLSRCRLMLYPGVHFEETNGHVCSEAMMCGVIPVVSDLGALSETVPSDVGFLFEGDANSTDYQARFVDKVVHLCYPGADSDVAERQRRGREHVLPRCTYENVLNLWERCFADLPVKRAVHAW